MSEAPAGLIPPKFNIDQPRFELKIMNRDVLNVELHIIEGYMLKIHNMNKHVYTDGTRAHIGEERASFSRPQTP